MMMHYTWARVVVAAALVVAGCSSAGGNPVGDSAGSVPAAGFRAHRSDAGDGMAAIVAGTVEFDLEAGCVWLTDPDGVRYPVVWPAGSSVQSNPFEITLVDGQSVTAGDRVMGGGGYVDAGAATRGLGQAPFPPECVHVGDAAVFNAGTVISVTAGDGVETAPTLVNRFAPPEPIGLELIAVNANARSVAVIDFVTGTVHRYGPGDYEGPGDAIDGASGGGGFIHLWSQGTIFTYDGKFDAQPLVYQPDPLREVPGIASTLEVVPGPDGEQTWLVQAGFGDEPTLVELINLVEVQVGRLMTTEIEGSWHPVGATVEGLVLTTDEPEPMTRLVAADGSTRADVLGTAISVGWNGAVVALADGSLAVTDAGLQNPVEVDRPAEGEWTSIGGPIVPATSPPVRTGTDEFLVMLADEPGKGSVGPGDLMIVGPAGRAVTLSELAPGSHLASWSRGGDWVVLVEGSSLTLISTDGSNIPLGDLVPESHWVYSAG